MQRIALIMDSEFGEKMIPLSEKMPVWVLESPLNKVVMEHIWKNWSYPERNVSGSDRWYKTDEENCVHCLYAIDEHFDSHTAWGGYEATEVYGMQLPEGFAEKLNEMEFSHLEETEFGFIVWK